MSVQSFEAYKKTKAACYLFRRNLPHSQFFNRIEKAFKTLLLADSANIYTYDPINDCLTAVWGYNDPRTRLPVSILDCGEMQALFPSAVVPRNRGTRLICCMFTGGRLIGAIDVQRNDLLPPYTWEDGQLIVRIGTVIKAVLSQPENVFIRNRKAELFRDGGLVSNGRKDTVVSTAQRRGMSVEEILISKAGKPKMVVMAAVCRLYGVPAMEITDNLEVSAGLLRGWSMEEMHANGYMPVTENYGTVTVAIDNPFDAQKVNHIRAKLKKKQVKFVLALKSDIQKYLGVFYQPSRSKKDEDELDLDLDLLLDL